MQRKNKSLFNLSKKELSFRKGVSGFFSYILTFAMEINQFDFSPFVRVPKMRINKDFLKGVKHDREYTDFNFLLS